MKIMTLLFSTFLLSSCTSIPSVSERITHADLLAKAANWQKQIIKTQHFELTSFSPKIQPKPNKQLTIFIEGDGLSWVTRSQPSKNPTPVNPIALKMALNSSFAQVVYLARPCQFNNQKVELCSSKLWTQDRFSVMVVLNMNEAIEILKKQHNAKSIQLIGFSGGGAIASIIASKRDDVESLITVAGNLNHKYWTNHHKITPLHNSLNPIKFSKTLANVHQIHLIGEMDSVIPKEVYESFRKNFIKTENIQSFIINNYTHGCCWDKDWAKLEKQYLKLKIEAKK